MKHTNFSFAVAVGLSLFSTARADTVSLNLDVSAETFTQYGLGPAPDGRGTYAFDQGACSFDGADTTCVLSGAFTGSTPAFSSGTYSFVTSYSGSGPQIEAIWSQGNANYWNYSYLPPDTSMQVNLHTAGGNYSEALVSNGDFVPDTSFYFSNATYACGGVSVPTCSQAEVGLVAGAIGYATVTTNVTFVSAVPEPQTLALVMIGLAGLGGVARRRAWPAARAGA